MAAGVCKSFCISYIIYYNIYLMYNNYTLLCKSGIPRAVYVCVPYARGSGMKAVIGPAIRGQLGSGPAQGLGLVLYTECLTFFLTTLHLPYVWPGLPTRCNHYV